MFVSLIVLIHSIKISIAGLNYLLLFFLSLLEQNYCEFYELPQCYFGIGEIS